MLNNVIKQVNGYRFGLSVLSKSRSILTGFKNNSANVDEKPDYKRKAMNAEAADINTSLDIEANLFNNSALQHKPAQVKKILREHQSRRQQAPKVIDNLKTNPTPTKNRKKAHASPDVIMDVELGLEFVRLGLGDPVLNALMTTVRSRKRRDKDREIIIEGRRLITEALTNKLPLRALIFSQKEQLSTIRDAIVQVQLNQRMPFKIYKVPQHDLKTWSTLTTPPGVMAIFERPSLKVLANKKLDSSVAPLPITVVCDNIREPNNLGSIIRTCAALPCLQVIVTRGCCDPWESKALRGGCGGHFRINIKDDVDWQQLASLIPTDEIEDCCAFIAENNLEKVPNIIEAIDYLKISRTGAHSIVIIGGETHGVSREAYEFLHFMGNKGKCLYIPVANNMDSLNVTSALTLILYELRKHLSECQVQNES